ncbi:Hypersensitive-induced response protein-like protein 2, partial [Cucurbita argyrosperma subsp. sororia]
MFLSPSFASIQYRALADKASDAFYKLSNTREQIQAYFFDGASVKSLDLDSNCRTEEKIFCKSCGMEDELEKAMAALWLQGMRGSCKLRKLKQRRYCRLRRADRRSRIPSILARARLLHGSGSSHWLTGSDRHRVLAFAKTSPGTTNLRDVMDMVLVTHILRHDERNREHRSKSNSVFHQPTGPDLLYPAKSPYLLKDFPYSSGAGKAVRKSSHGGPPRSINLSIELPVSYLGVKEVESKFSSRRKPLILRLIIKGRRPDESYSFFKVLTEADPLGARKEERIREDPSESRMTVSGE